MSAELENELKIFFKDLEWRGIISNHANLENFYHLKPEEKVIYLGIDCTGESLHIGHLFQLIQTIRFAKEGFTILLVLGGATSKIGDPSDKEVERKRLETEQLNNYYHKIKNQVTRLVIRSPLTKTATEIAKKTKLAPLELFYADKPNLLKDIYKIFKISMEDEKEKKWEKYLNYIWPLQDNKFKILNNNDWLSKISFIDFIDKVGRKIRVNNLIKKEFVKKRIDSEVGLSFLEFSYSLLQAYDFWHLYQNYNCHGQLGGSDQWGNLTVGLELIEKFYPGGKTKIFAFNFNLLTDKEGNKLSKSENNGVSLNNSRHEFFDFFRNMTDEQAEMYLKQFTFLSQQQIDELLKLNNPKKLRIPQRILLELEWFLNYGEILNERN
ncbi:tyrosine--tRNA ligase [endosymbiont GvMRE of Glomus versiforme]|uniref:tyrosine--tRNA ligase n=1 Tax=endosymbiont GvMRE of Glomus versiforme TaxID=2039283 RepID=UPI000ED36267|nr:tyrosine--tRNA ligase [endosymbiont GvMRE of Glomus versiforme]RHZ36467.1 Tyrosine--tRNA ligase [endosymbiont GvMRE of Glomus versiforme]